MWLYELQNKLVCKIYIEIDEFVAIENALRDLVAEFGQFELFAERLQPRAVQHLLTIDAAR